MKNSFDYTADEIRRWGDEASYTAACLAVDKGAVMRAAYDAETRTATGEVLMNGVPVKVSFKTLPQTRSRVDNGCSCPASSKCGLMCFHTLAVALVLARRAESARNPEARDEEAAKARRCEENLNAGKSVRRSSRGVPCEMAVLTDADFTAAFDTVAAPEDPKPQQRRGRPAPERRTTVRLCVMFKPISGPRAGSWISHSECATSKLMINLDEASAHLLDVVEEIAECDFTPKFLNVAPGDFMWLLDVMGRDGLSFFAGGKPFVVMPRENAVKSRVDASFDAESGEILLALNSKIPGAEEGTIPEYLVAAGHGYAMLDDTLWPLARTLPDAYIKLYRETIPIDRKFTKNFLERELDRMASLFDVSVEFQRDLFTFTPGRPRFRLVATAHDGEKDEREITPETLGDRTTVAFQLYADYKIPGVNRDESVFANVPGQNISIPDDKDPYVYFERNFTAERAALSTLASFGITGPGGVTDGMQMRGDRLESIRGAEQILAFLASTIPAIRAMDNWAAVPEKKLASLQSKCDFVKVCVSAADVPDTPGIFEFKYMFRAQHGEYPLSANEISRAKAYGHSYIRNSHGKLMLFDAAAIDTLASLQRECGMTSAGPDGLIQSVHISSAQAPYVLGRVKRLDTSKVEFDDSSAQWVRRHEEFLRGRGIAEDKTAIPEDVRKILRPYQRDGVVWLRFLERNDFCGILADEMGLGKTLQALAWISMERCHEGERNRPALVVCPTSLVENWEREAEQFTPDLKVLVLSGPDRREMFERADEYDLVITSYALLRRDTDFYSSHRFSIAILDEAQNIKNRTTQNFLSARRICARSRLAITGTPIENALSDLWSVMDFLMPGYLGDYPEFRAYYEVPASLRGDPLSMPSQVRDAERVLAKLHDRIAPFMLRRLKDTVAKDLPPKIVQTSWTPMSAEQKAVYDTWLAKSRETISAAVSSNGFGASHMVILTELLRLRQIACHLSLLGDKNPAPDAEEPSGKLQALLDVVDEAAAEGHRVLVFSQFVEMLKLVRAAFDERNIRYCYIDGQSTDRLESVHRFNTDPTIPAFLISLKAGGTGLNLTGADEVVLLDPWWNPAIEDQAIDRAHRIGQKRTVHALKFIAPGTVEEKVLDMQRRKKAIIQATISTSDADSIGKLSWDDVRKLFSM